jgi:hypothetical protein
MLSSLRLLDRYKGTLIGPDELSLNAVLTLYESYGKRFSG